MKKPLFYNVKLTGVQKHIKGNYWEYADRSTVGYIIDSLSAGGGCYPVPEWHNQEVHFEINGDYYLTITPIYSL